ncbi:MAG: LysM peptidoglycan-binding domain-containing protein, partial [Cyanobacteria bacterium REEB65]|nr:LysM peptidoglycan-binding domain-containing protein [Cyanobacteria bacterium REEB65]
MHSDLQGGDSLFFELEWLEAAIAAGTLSRAEVGVLRGSRVWRIAEPKRYKLPGHALAFALTAAVFPLPAQASEANVAYQVATASMTVRVVDSSTGKPLEGVQIVAESGEVLGTTDRTGRAAVQRGFAGEKASLVKAGYRSFRLTLPELKSGGTVFVGLSRVPGAPAPTHEAAAPSSHAPAPASKTAVIRKPSPKAAPPSPKATGTHKVVKVAATKASAKPTERTVRKPSPKPPVHQAVAKPVVPKAVARPARPHKPKPVLHKRPVQTPERKAATKPTGVKSHAVLGHSYRVHHGDTLWAIAEKQLGNPYLWGALYRANRAEIARPDLIHPGELLRIPVERLAHAATGRGGVIVVHPGDSLWSLATEYLGSGERWHLLYRLNQRQIANPRVIHPGQILRTSSHSQTEPSRKGQHRMRHHRSHAASPARAKAPAPNGLGAVNPPKRHVAEPKSSDPDAHPTSAPASLSIYETHPVTLPLEASPPPASSVFPVAGGDMAQRSPQGIPLAVLVPLGRAPGGTANAVNTGLELRSMSFEDVGGLGRWATWLQAGYGENPGQALYVAGAVAKDIFGAIPLGQGSLHVVAPFLGLRGIVDMPGGSARSMVGLDLPSIGGSIDYRVGMLGFHLMGSYDPVLSQAISSESAGVGQVPNMALGT